MTDFDYTLNKKKEIKSYILVEIGPLTLKWNKVFNLEGVVELLLNPSMIFLHFSFSDPVF